MNENQQIVPENEYKNILNLAVVIMGSVSCYTTAVGLEPMIGIKIFSFGIAVALSLFMIIIALSLPKAESTSKRRGSIMAYSLVAFFSILLNFNAIYGLFNKKTLLNEELTSKRDLLVNLQRVSINDVDSLYRVTHWGGEVEAARERMEQEKLTPGEEGCGPRCRKIYREEVLPAEGELKKARIKAQPIKSLIASKISKIYPEPINSIISRKEPKEMEKGIDQIVAVYQDISKDIGPRTGKNYGNMTSENENIGNLNHAVNTIANFPNAKGEAKSSIFISFLLSFIIDFIILFVILFLSPSIESPKKGNQKKKSMPIWTRKKSGNSGRRGSGDGLFSGRN